MATSDIVCQSVDGCAVCCHTILFVGRHIFVTVGKHRLISFVSLRSYTELTVDRPYRRFLGSGSKARNGWDHAVGVENSRKCHYCDSELGG